MICLIPSRAGSKRIPGKNTKMLGGKPLIAWTIEAAQNAAVFDRIAVCTDDTDTAAIARKWGADTQMRPTASDTQPDLEWLTYAMETGLLAEYDEFCIARVTSPFRSAATIRRAFEEWSRVKYDVDSMRAVRRVSESPFKMWINTGPHGATRLLPLLDPDMTDDEQPWNMPTQGLGDVFVQTAGIECAWTERTVAKGSISGDRIAPFVVSGPEALDCNDEWDWWIAERIAGMM